jgi:nicotinamide phosphoribosyltransferase
MTVCTLSRNYKETIARYLVETGSSPALAVTKLHDFGYRGASSVESAAIGDAAHLVNFNGTDTVAGLRLCRKFYHCRMAGHSIPAAEHRCVRARFPHTVYLIAQHDHIMG